MTQIRARVVRARVAGARRINGSGVVGVAGVSDVETSLAGEELTVSGVPRRHHTVEHVDAARDTLHHVFGCSYPHQVHRLLLGKVTGGFANDGVHLLDGLADAQPSNRVPVESDRSRGLGAHQAQVLEDTALDNAKLRLA